MQMMSLIQHPAQLNSFAERTLKVHSALSRKTTPLQANGSALWR